MNQYLTANLISDLVNVVLFLGAGALVALMQVKWKGSATATVPPGHRTAQLARDLHWAVEDYKSFREARQLLTIVEGSHYSNHAEQVLLERVKTAHNLMVEQAMSVATHVPAARTDDYNDMMSQQRDRALDELGSAQRNLALAEEALAAALAGKPRPGG